jgi:hypothetical protein
MEWGFAMVRREWVFMPKAIPDDVKRNFEKRLRKHVSEEWKEHCRELVIRFKGRFAYVDAFPIEQDSMEGLTEEEKARVEATPTKLCRFEYTGDPESWLYAFYKYSDERYEPCISLSGSFYCTPEEGFDTSANVYLRY